jgi:hypothetical protein
VDLQAGQPFLQGLVVSGCMVAGWESFTRAGGQQRVYAREHDFLFLDTYRTARFRPARLCSGEYRPVAGAGAENLLPPAR